MVNLISPHHRLNGSFMPSELNALDRRYAQLRQKMDWLKSCADPEIPETFKDLLDSLEQLFAFETQLMEKHRFPVTRAHLEQHARVLQGLHRTHAHVMNGQLSKGRYVGTQLLSSWFELHNGTMDACLAVWLASIQPSRNAKAAVRGALSPQLMRDLSHKSSSLWSPFRRTELGKIDRDSRRNGQSPGEQ